MLIQNGNVVLESEVRPADIRVESEKIVEVGRSLPPKIGEMILDAAGRYIVPGGIDAHTHLDMPCGDITTADGFRAGSLAAIAGGTTTVLEYAECAAGETLEQGLANWHRKAAGKSYCDYGFHMTVSAWTKDMPAQMTAVAADGVTSFKTYTAYQNDIGVDDYALFRIMQEAGRLGALVCVHCENDGLLRAFSEDLEARKSDVSAHPDSRPNLVEAEAVSRTADIGMLAGAAVYIVHISTKEGAEAVRRARERGQTIFGETCPHYLLLDRSRYDLPGFEGAKFVMSPPLRTSEDQSALWGALREGTLQTVSTDHCAFRFADQKTLGRQDFRKIPNGVPSVEHRMELLYTFGAAQGMTLPQIAAVTAWNPAQIFGLSHRKGRIAPGYDADLVLLDLNAPHALSAATQVQAVDYTPYEGMRVQAKVDTVLLRGQVLMRNGALTAETPHGSYLFRTLPQRKRTEEE